MNLSTIIKNKLKSLYKEYNKINKKGNNKEEVLLLDKLYKFISDIKSTDKNLLNYKEEELKELLENIYKEEELNEILEQIRLISIVLIGKYERNLSINLSDNQTKTFDKITKKITKYIEKQSEKIKENETLFEENKEYLSEIELIILELEEINSKLRNKENKEIITQEEFDYLYELFIEDESLSFEEKRNILLAFKEYNDKISSKIINEIDTKKIKDLIDIFISFGIDEKIEKYIKKHEYEISTNIDLDNVKSVLEFMKDVNILRRFDLSTILGICLDGTKESVENTYNRMKELNLSSKMFYETSGVWIDNIPKEIKKRKKHNYKRGKEKEVSYQAINHEISFEELLENERFLRNLGYDVSIANEKSAKTLKTPNYKIRENYELLKLYGILDAVEPENFSTSAFAFSNIDDKCDKFIELGLLNGSDIVRFPNSNYIAKFPSAISFMRNEIYMLLYKLKKDKSPIDYYDTIFSEYIEGRLSPKVYKDKLNFRLNNETEIEEFKNDNFIEQMDYIKNSNIYEEAILSNMPINYDESVFEIPEILELEQNNKENKYIYKIGNQIISRLKVLRCLTALKQTLVKIDKDAIMYSLVRGTYLDELTFNAIAKTIGYSYKGGLNNGISKNI